jgi:anaerobic selenocysteine-containing dehydrogenase
MRKNRNTGDHDFRNENHMKTAVSRRTFIKLGVTSLSGALLSESGTDARAMGTASVPPNLAPERSVKSYCPFCQVRCTYQAQIRDGKIVSLIGEAGNRWTGGGMCPKGMSIVELVNSPHRITEPRLRTASGWQTISYAAAVDLVAEKLTAARAKHGPAVAQRLALTAPLWDCRESELAALMTLRLAGGVNVMHSGEVCISTASSMFSTLLGTGNSTTTVNQIVNAATVVLFGANISETYPPYSRWLDKARAAGVNILYVDCRKTQTSGFCSRQLMPLPGTDGVLALGAVKYFIDSGACDQDYVARTTTGFDTLAKDVAGYDPAKVASLTGLSPAEIEDFYRTLAASRRTIVWLGGSLSRYAGGSATIRAIIAMQAVLNNLAGPGKGLLTMEGGKPEGEDEFIDQACGPAPGSGVNFRRLLAAMKKGDVDVLFLNSSYRRYPDGNGVREALKSVGFVVHRGFFPTEELDVTHLFVPATFSPESQGSHYGAEKQVVWRDKCVDAPGSCVPDWQFYRDVGRKIAPDRYPKFDSPEELFELFRQTVPSWRGITLERLKASPDGVVWPAESEDAPERTGSLFPEDGRMLTANGRHDFAPKMLGPIVWSPPKGSPKGPDRDEKYPLILIQGKIVTQWQQTLTNFAASLAQFSSGRYVLLHPDTARGLGIGQGEEVLLETAFGSVEARAELAGTILPGVVFTPSHFAGSSPFPQTRSTPINDILPNYWDRVSAQFNGLGCTLKKRT